MVAITAIPNTIARPRPSRPSSRPAPAPSALRLVPDRRPVAAVTVRGLPGVLATILLAAVAMLAITALVRAEPLAEPGTIGLADSVHVVAEGETMWSIAVDRAPAGEAAAYVERLVEVNGSAVVVPGQSLQLPRR